MPHRKSQDASSKIAESNALVSCEPLLARINPLMYGRHTTCSIACHVLAAGVPSEWVLDPPFFTRMIAEAGLSLLQKRAYLAELSRFGVAWLGDSLSSPASGLEATPRIASIHIDQPIDIESYRSAAAIELQLFGVPFQTIHNSRRSRWTPGLPIEISDFEQLGMKIDLLREVMGPGVPIGAALTPGAVYEDMRFLIDSGFDFVTILCQVQHGMVPSSTLELAPLDATLDQAAKAIQDAGAKTKLFVAANLLDGRQMYRCLQLGAAAVCIDSFVANNKPKDPTPVKDTLGSVLTAYAPTASTVAYPWLATAMSNLVEELTDCATYSGKGHSRHE